MRSNFSSQNPFHLAVPVHCMIKGTSLHKIIKHILNLDVMEIAREFYGNVLELTEGRRSENKWQDYNIFGHQLVCHYVGENYKGVDYFNPGFY